MKIIASLQHSDLPQRQIIDECRSVVRIPTLVKRRGLFSKVVNMIEWNFRAFMLLYRQPIACINAHSLAVLPVSVLLKILASCRLVYDAHEIETETTETKGIRKIISKIIEKFLMGFVDTLCLTSFGHQRWYHNNFEAVNIRVVRNCPYIPKENPFSDERSLFRKYFSIPNKDLIFLYQGSIAKPRGTDVILKVFEELPPNFHIVFMGFGPDVNKVIDLANLNPNIHYLPAVSPDEVFKYTSGADVGIHMMDDSCINHLHALPNKPMEYMNAGLACIVTDLPEMGELIRNARAGWTIPVGDHLALRDVVLNMTKEKALTRSRASCEWARENNWESEESKLRDLYRDLGFPRRL